MAMAMAVCWGGVQSSVVISELETATNPLTFDKVQNSLRLPYKTTPERQKTLRTHMLYTFDFETYFDITERAFSTRQLKKKNIPGNVSFVHF